MRTHKATKSVSTRTAAIALIERGREEDFLLERWATSDSARTMDDAEWDESQDRFEIASVSDSSHGYDA